jgi:DNA-binding transcriptional LysR family regulator
MRSIDRRCLPLNALRAFECVAQHGSFTGAAQALLISQSTLSQHVITLEGLIGVRLFERRHSGLVLTRAGEHLLATVGKSLDRLEHALEGIRNGGAPVVRTLRVQMPLSFAAHLAVPILRDFRQGRAGAEIDLVSPSAAGPLPRDVDLAVMFSRPSAGDFVVDLLWSVRLRLLCHPQFAERHRGKDLAAFIDASEIVHVCNDGSARHECWSRFIRYHELGDLAVKRGPVFDSAALAIQYVASGEGIALLDPRLFVDEIRDVRLVSPFAEELATGQACYLVTHPESLSDAAVGLFRSWLVERFGQEPFAAEAMAESAAVKGRGRGRWERSVLGQSGRARPGEEGRSEQPLDAG